MASSATRREPGEPRFRDHAAAGTGAPSGIDAGTAERPTRERAHVLVADIDDAGGAQLAARIGAAGGSIRFSHLNAVQGADWDAPAGHIGQTRWRPEPAAAVVVPGLRRRLLHQRGIPGGGRRLERGQGLGLTQEG